MKKGGRHSLTGETLRALNKVNVSGDPSGTGFECNASTVEAHRNREWV